ncbi:MAG: hypothetical protein JNM52_05440, partial [Betaproteobacteria bacterium]|nr:hypothetical protein [Betaproteobacteria bacterium]
MSLLSEEKLRSLIELSEDSFWHLGPDFFLTHIDIHPELAIAASLQRLPGRLIWDIPGLVETERHALRAALFSQKTFKRLPLTLHLADASPLTLQLSGQPLFDEKDIFCGYFMQAQDISAATNSLAPGDEASLVELRERTHDLELAVREFDAFSRSVSHDLQAPLRIIQGFTDILSEDYAHILDALGNDHLKRIKSASERMHKMLSVLLEMAHMTSEPLHKEPLNLSRMVVGLLAELANQQPDRLVETSITLDIHAVADRTMMRILLWSLIDNAWKATKPTADAHIEFGQTKVADQVAYFVRDNG